ncbi:hypothetical protein PSm6_44820 [Pseudomonas solani]|uniref:DUF2514 domain-containing protein n=1 Tax=Pseudomonas solani TaxID=2731552 RepID=A0ABM7LES1_9PSED|nr:hypothetical protein [Pseudomonas solani]BCD88075.1 hypothetical protein PSm6_44820 [Pseudomonas solani]
MIGAIPVRLVLSGVALLAAGALGAWLAAGHYKPQLDEAQDLAAQCRLARGALESAVAEQNARVAQLRAEAEQRQQVAAQAQQEARKVAAVDYAAAQRLQQERIGGDQCTAAATVIDRELGL